MFLNNPYPTIFPHVNSNYINYKHKLLSPPKFNDNLSDTNNTTKCEHSSKINSQSKNNFNAFPESILSFFSSDDLILLAVLCLLCNSEKNDIFLILIILLLFLDI